MEAPQNSISLQEALAQYQQILLTARNLVPRTRQEYTRDLRELIDFLETRCFVFLARRVERNHLEHYLAELDHRGFNGNSRRRKYASARSFFGYLLQAELIERDPTQRLIPPAREHRRPRVLTESEYKRLQLAVAHEVRDAAIIELLLQTGMRRSELARLTLADIELPAKISREHGHVRAVHILGKGRKDRTVTLNWRACRALGHSLSPWCHVHHPSDAAPVAPPWRDPRQPPGTGPLPGRPRRRPGVGRRRIGGALDQHEVEDALHAAALIGRGWPAVRASAGSATVPASVLG